MSDWDFEVDTADFEAVARDLPAVVSPLRPLAQQWDRLSRHQTYMLILRGPIKIDLLFLDRPNEQKPPWEVSAATLQGVDHHFWDWILWLASKHSAGKHGLVEQEFAKMSTHLLRPMEVDQVPDAVEAAVALYTSARRELENRLGVEVPKELGDEIQAALWASGYDLTG